jgi:hypothetical protein
MRKQMALRKQALWKMPNKHSTPKVIIMPNLQDEDQISAQARIPVAARGRGGRICHRCYCCGCCCCCHAGLLLPRQPHRPLIKQAKD